MSTHLTPVGAARRTAAVLASFLLCLLMACEKESPQNATAPADLVAEDGDAGAGAAMGTAESNATVGGASGTAGTAPEGTAAGDPNAAVPGATASGTTTDQAPATGATAGSPVTAGDKDTAGSADTAAGNDTVAGKDTAGTAARNDIKDKIGTAGQLTVAGPGGRRIPLKNAQCKSDNDCTIMCIRAPCPRGVCRSGKCAIEAALTPCATVRCKQGTECRAYGREAKCVPVQTPTKPPANPPTKPPVSAKPPCQPSGCSGQICSDQQVMSTCEFRPEYACYKGATCTRQPSGECGWTQTKALTQCIADKRASGSLKQPLTK